MLTNWHGRILSGLSSGTQVMLCNQVEALTAW